MGRTWRMSAALSVAAFLAATVGLVAPAQAAPAADLATATDRTIATDRATDRAARAPFGQWIDPRPSNDQLARELTRLERQSDGAIEVSEIGRSNAGNPVWNARVGDGPRRILYVTQQHGDEPWGTPAALEFLRELGVDDGAWQRKLREQLTVSLIVRANPDGHERDWRYTYVPNVDPEHGKPGQGHDLNRYHAPDLDPDANPATEAAHIQAHYAEFDPELVVDYHMQGRYLADNGEEITASVMWPTHPDVDTAALDLAKQAAVVSASAMTAAGANISRYPGGDYEGIARNAYGLRGSGSVLVELSRVPDLEQEQIRSALTSMRAIARAAGNGTLDLVDPAQTEVIPPRGEPLESEQPADVAANEGTS